ncbi:MAG: DUF3370 family protein [Microcoleus sp.]
MLEEGILLSTFPPNRKRFPTAHLNFPFQGRFDLFVPPIAKAAVPENLRTLYQGFIVYNPTSKIRSITSGELFESSRCAVY